MWMLMLDGGAHRRIRGLVNLVFNARSIQKKMLWRCPCR